MKRGEITKENLEEAIEKDASWIKWDRELKRALFQGRSHTLDNGGRVYAAQYRSFVPMWLYFSRVFNGMIYQLPRIWPTPDGENVAIAVAGVGS